MFDLDRAVRKHFEFDALKHQLHREAGMELDEWVDDKINSLSNVEYLFYISLALELDNHD